jgi:hypothetical protein
MASTTKTQQSREGDVFEKCVSIMEALECGSRETFANEWIGRRTTNHRIVSLGDLKMSLVVTHTEKNKNSGCLLYSWEETEKEMTVKQGEKLVFKCIDNHEDPASFGSGKWRRIDAYVPGEWENDVETLLKMVESSPPKTQTEIDAFGRIRKELKVGFGLTFDDALRIMRDK